MNYVDIHGHYAWNIDDGIASLSEAKKALSQAKHQGITTIVATPHVTCGLTTKQDITHFKNRIQELKELAKHYHIKVLEGCELMLNDDIFDTLEKGTFIPIENTSYVLCEYDLRKSTESFMENFDHYVQEVIIHGYTPIVAHIERYFREEIDLDYVHYLKKIGCLFQVNTTSIMGKSLPIFQHNALTLLDHQLVHFIATDTHHIHTKRSPNTQKCFYYLYKQGYTRKYLRYLMQENPYKMINQQMVLDFSNHKSMISFKLLFKFLHHFIPIKKRYK